MKQDTIKFLKKHDVEYRWLDHQALFTVSDFDKLTEHLEPIKNLLLIEDKGDKKFLIVMAGKDKLDIKLLRNKLQSKRLRFASDNILMSTLCTTPGSVSIFSFLNGGLNDAKVIIDKDLLDKDELGFHPNNNTATVFISPDNIEPMLKSMNCSYEIIKLS